MATGRWATQVQLPEQTDPPRSPCETLPTMYDLPSEDPKEPGLPDEFHDYQPQLLRETFQPPRFMPDRFFVGTDLNLYYTTEPSSLVQTPRLVRGPGSPTFVSRSRICA